MEPHMLGAQQLNPETSDKEPTIACTKQKSCGLQIGILLAIAAITIVCYSPILFNFFAGDDYVHLTWLHRVIKDLSTRVITDPELIWRNFHSSWLDGTTTKFYRPLISVFMVTDYELWGLNGLGFHVTNLLFHLASTVFIFLSAKNLQELSNIEKRDAEVESEGAVLETALPSSGTFDKKKLLELRWPIAAATLFALYPLHPEAVSWITGRVDSVVTAYCMGALYFYIRFSRSSKKAYLLLSLLSTALGLISKEMAITLPAVFLLYELIYSVPSKYQTLVSKAAAFKANQGLKASDDPNSPILAQDSSSNLELKSQLENESPGKQFDALIAINSFSPLMLTMPFWILLAVYAVVRTMALQTIVGGYDNSLTFIPDMGVFIRGWLHAIMMLLIPINKSLIGSHHILNKLWQAGVIFCIASGLANIAFQWRNSKHLLFLWGWLILCLAPVYKLFNIADDLQGSRLAYLATVPVCMLLTCGLLQCRKLDKSVVWKISSNTAMALMLILSGVLLWTNNQPWRKAGEENNAIRASLQKLYDQVPGDPEVLFLGLPDQIEGAYTCRNSLDGMTKYPQISRDIQHCLMVNAFEPILPFGFLKESIAANKDKILIYKWDEAKKTFDKINIETKGENNPRIDWQSPQLKDCVSAPDQKFKPQLEWGPDGTLTVIRSGAKPQYLELDLGKNSCWDTEYVEVDIKLDQPAAPNTAADLQYSNDMYPEFELRRRATSHLVTGQQEQHMLFGMGGLPEWSLGGNTHKFRLLLPSNQKFSISSISLLPRRFAMAKLSFPNSGYFGSKGYLHLGPTQMEQKIEADLSQVKDAEKFSVEITRTNLLFEEQNTQQTSKVSKSNEVYGGAKAEIVLNFRDFLNAPGIYELRVFPLRKDGTICGAASDHLVISVDP